MKTVVAPGLGIIPSAQLLKAPLCFADTFTESSFHCAKVLKRPFSLSFGQYPYPHVSVLGSMPLSCLVESPSDALELVLGIHLGRLPGGNCLASPVKKSKQNLQ